MYSTISMITCLLSFARSLPSACPLSSEAGGLGLLGAGSGDHLLMEGPSAALAAAFAASVCSAPAAVLWPQASTREPESQRRVGLGGGGQQGALWPFPR